MEDINEIIKNRDEKKLRKIAIGILKGVISGKEDKDEVSYFPSYFITIPLELGWDDNYHIKDKTLDKDFDLITNFEGISKKRAIQQSKIMLKKLRKRTNKILENNKK